MPQIDIESKSYLTRQTAERKAREKIPEGVRYLIAATPDGKFAPVIVWSERTCSVPVGQLISLGFLVTN